MFKDPHVVSDELVELTRLLGQPAEDFVILGEGNTSTVVDGDRFVVKASGVRMATAGRDDFVCGSVAPFMEALHMDGVDQQGLSQLLVVDTSTGPIRASIETLVHVAAISVGATWVAHTHPTALVGLLSIAEAEAIWATPFFPDEAVVLGQPLFVPYAAPGLALGHSVLTALNERIAAAGDRPRLMLLGNHGIVAMGDSAAEVEAISRMAVKAARVRSVALGAGVPTPLAAHEARSLHVREDEVLRRESLRVRRSAS